MPGAAVVEDVVEDVVEEVVVVGFGSQIHVGQSMSLWSSWTHPSRWHGGSQIAVSFALM